MDFTILERIRFKHIDSGGPYVQLIDLPSWGAPSMMLTYEDILWLNYL